MESARTPIPIGVVTNPNSKKNRLRHRRAEELQRILGPLGLVRETRNVGEIRPAVEEFFDREVRYWVSDGGDGALHWLVNEVREAMPRSPDAVGPGGGGTALPIFVPTNGGTIDFVAKKAGIRGEADEILKSLVQAERSGREFVLEEVESLLVEGERLEEDGALRPFRRVGFCAAIAGIGQRFFEEYYRDPFPDTRTLVTIIAKGLASIALNVTGLARLPIVSADWSGYVTGFLRPQRARVLVDGTPLQGEQWRALHVGAIYADLGGVVRLFPLAGKGKLHVVAGNPSMLEVARCVPRLIAGGTMVGVHEAAATALEVEALGEEALCPVIDGEIFRGVRRLRVGPGPLLRIPRVPG